jgi:hypothetical protein
VKVKIYGFEWATGADTTLEEFLTYLKGESGKEYIDDNQVIAVRKMGDFWAGVLLTIKDMKAYCQLKRSGHGFEVSVQNLEKGTSIVDVNFFIIHPITGRGLYQYYYHSAAMGLFANFCKHRYASFRSLNGRRGALKHAMLVKGDSLENYIQELDRIKSFEFEAFTYQSNERDFRAVSDLADRVVHRAVFIKPSKGRQAVNAIVNLLKQEKVSKANIKGVDGDGTEVFYKLLNDPAVFQEYDYDTFIRTVRLDTNDLEGTVKKSPNVAELIRLSKQPDINELLTTEVNE